MKISIYFLILLFFVISFHTNTIAQDYWDVFTVDGLADNGATPVLEDSRGNIWFLVKKGVLKYDGTTWTNYSTSHGLVSDEISSGSDISGSSYTVTSSYSNGDLVRI